MGYEENQTVSRWNTTSCSLHGAFLELSWSHPEAFLEPSWSIPGAFLEPFGDHRLAKLCNRELTFMLVSYSFV